MANRALAWAVALIIGAALQACAVSYPPAPDPASQIGKPTASTNDASDITGVWQGRSIAGCFGGASFSRCLAQQKISLTMIQDGAHVSGFYNCSYGNRMCLQLDRNGRIRNGLVRDERLMIRVMLSGGLTCFFTGTFLPQEKLAGSYLCLEGGGLVEVGRFYVQRSY